MELNSEKTVSCTAAPGKVVEINGFGSRQKEQILQSCGESGEAILLNHLFRISAKFEVLSSDAQIELYGFAKGRIRGTGEGASLKDRLLSVLASGCRVDGALEEIEEFADTFLIKEKAYKRVGEGLDLCPNSLLMGKEDEHNAISIN